MFTTGKLCPASANERFLTKTARRYPTKKAWTSRQTQLVFMKETCAHEGQNGEFCLKLLGSTSQKRLEKPWKPAPAFMKRTCAHQEKMKRSKLKVLGGASGKRPENNEQWNYGTFVYEGQNVHGRGSWLKPPGGNVRKRLEKMHLVFMRSTIQKRLENHEKTQTCVYEGELCAHQGQLCGIFGNKY